VAVIVRWQWHGSGGGVRRQRVSAEEVAVVVVILGAFECHRRANVRAFILGRGWRDNGAVDVFILGRGWRDNGAR
jgi:hypothetical protein